MIIYPFSNPYVSFMLLLIFSLRIMTLFFSRLMLMNVTRSSSSLQKGVSHKVVQILRILKLACPNLELLGFFFINMLYITKLNSMRVKVSFLFKPHFLIYVEKGVPLLLFPLDQAPLPKIPTFFPPFLRLSNGIPDVTFGGSVKSSWRLGEPDFTLTGFIHLHRLEMTLEISSLELNQGVKGEV